MLFLILIVLLVIAAVMTGSMIPVWVAVGLTVLAILAVIGESSR